MLKENILKKNWEFQDIIKEKKQIISKSLIFYFRANSEKTRIGISISKKFAPATGRNRLRRQVRALLDEIQPWQFKKDIIIILRKPFLDLTFLQKKNALNEMFGRL